MSFITILGMTFVREGLIRGFIFLILGVLALFPRHFATYVIAAVFLFFALFTLYFFRHPERSPEGDGFVCPADGVVVLVEKTEDDFVGDALRIGIFMSPLNVHVNRVPVDCHVFDSIHKPGKFLRADSENAPIENEQNHLLLESEYGRIKIVQTAGAVARRIVCPVHKGDTIKRADVFGMIKFGSRVDIYLPSDYPSTVTEDQRVYAGETIIADWIK